MEASLQLVSTHTGAELREILQLPAEGKSHEKMLAISHIVARNTAGVFLKYLGIFIHSGYVADYCQGF